MEEEVPIIVPLIQHYLLILLYLMPMVVLIAAQQILA